MLERDDEASIRPSVFDRLTHAGNERSLHWGIEDVKRAIIRDLWWLLNTRCWTFDRQAGHVRSHEATGAGGSLLDYGLPDFSDISTKDQSGQDFLGNELERVIRHFEPRLQGATVPGVTEDSAHQALCFDVIAELLMPSQAAPESVLLQAVLSLHDRVYTVKEE